MQGGNADSNMAAANADNGHISTNNNGVSNNFLRPLSRQRQRQVDDHDDQPHSSTSSNITRLLTNPLTPQRSGKSTKQSNATIESTQTSLSNHQRQTKQRPQPVRWLANAANPFLHGGERKDRQSQSTSTNMSSSTYTTLTTSTSSNQKMTTITNKSPDVHIDGDTESEEIEDILTTKGAAAPPNKRKKKVTRGEIGGGADASDDSDDDGMVSDDESLASTIRERAEKNASTPNDGKTIDPPASGDEIWLNAGIALTATSTTFETNSSCGSSSCGDDDEDDRLLLFDDDQDDGSRRYKGKRRGKKDAPGSPSRREKVTRSAVSDLMFGADDAEVDVSIDQGNDVNDVAETEKGDSNSLAGSLAVSLFGRFMNAAGSIDGRRHSKDCASEDSFDGGDDDIQKNDNGRNEQQDEGDTIENEDGLESIEGIVSKTLPSEILTLSSRSPSQSSPSSRNKRNTPRSTATALENAQELANQLARDLETLREENEKLLSTNRRLLSSLQGVKQYQEDNMILRSRLIKSALYCSPIFYFCGGLDSFLSTGKWKNEQTSRPVTETRFVTFLPRHSVVPSFYVLYLSNTNHFQSFVPLLDQIHSITGLGTR